MYMADRKVTAWFTMNGKHIPIFEGESKQDAIKRSIKPGKTDIKQSKVETPPKKADTIDKKTAEIDKKQSDAEQNKPDLKTDGQKKEPSKMTATAKTQSEHRQAIKDLDSDKYEDGTYDISTKKSVDFPKGFQYTFCQIGDDYSDDDYAKKVNSSLALSSNGSTYAGKFGGTPEISFHCNGKDEAIEYARANNQVSIWDWENCLTIKTGGTGIQPKEFGLSDDQYWKVLNFIHSKPKYEEQFNNILDSDDYVPKIKSFVKQVYNKVNV